MTEPLFLLPVIALVAFTLKAMTGFGPAMVVVALGSLLIPPHSVVAVSAILDLVAGAILYRADPIEDGRGFWVPLAIAIVIGCIIGGLTLQLVAPDVFHFILGIAVFLLGLWFVAGRSRSEQGALAEELPCQCSTADLGVTLFSGFCGGFIGISGPPIIWYLGRRFAKRAFRQTLITVFLAAAMARVLTYSSVGLVDRQILLYAIVSLPGLLVGIYLGNRVFSRLSEASFSKVVGVLLIVEAVRILTSG